MSNYFHLVLETPQLNLANGMKWLLGIYTQRFNRRHRHWGHLFGGRYILTEIYPAITTKVEFEELKNSIAIQSSIPFTAIYVAGDFGYGRDGPGVYFCWRVDEREG
jgi:hypothetical protein